MNIPKLIYSGRKREYGLYTEKQRKDALITYLFEGKAHRWIDREVLKLDDNVSKGYQSMGILHYLGISGEFKGIFNKMSLDEAIIQLEEDSQDFANIIDIIKFDVESSVNLFSWNILDKHIISKEMDMSVFKYKGSTIPRGIYEFFKIDDNQVHIKISLYYFEEEYSAYISKDKRDKPRFRVFWHSDFDKRIHERFPKYKEMALEGKFDDLTVKPMMYFEKIDDNKYIVSFDENVEDSIFIEAAFVQEIKKSRKLERKERLSRLNNADKFPEIVNVITSSFKRNPDVVAEVLERANGKCERCNSFAPFRRASDGSPYLEVHHKVMLSEGGEDTVNNAIAVCPNCHRELHYGDNSN